MTARWILGHPGKDLIFLFLPGLAMLILVNIFPVQSMGTYGLLLLFLAKGFADSGHVYTTVWRTYFNPLERNSKALYIWLPLVIFIFCAVSIGFEVPYFWSFVIYATLFHNIRQLYGINKWYRKINRMNRPEADFFLQILCFLPILSYHFRKVPALGHYYFKNETFAYPSEALYRFSLLVYVLLLMIWFVFEIRSYWRSRNINWGYASSFLLAVLMYGVGFINGKNVEQVILPLVIAHGISYQALVAFAMVKTQKEKYKFWWQALAYVTLTALLLGGLEFGYENEWLPLKMPEAMDLAVSATIITVLLCHYYFDMILWKAKHREAAKIYQMDI